MPYFEPKPRVPYHSIQEQETGETPARRRRGNAAVALAILSLAGLFLLRFAGSSPVIPIAIVSGLFLSTAMLAVRIVNTTRLDVAQDEPQFQPINRRAMRRTIVICAVGMGMLALVVVGFIRGALAG